MFGREVLPRLDPTGRALIARVGRGVRGAVVSSGLLLAGLSEEAPFKVVDFVGSDAVGLGQGGRVPVE